jgi:cell division protein ZapA
MAQVNVTISGKTYRMACEDGQEDHLVGMAEKLNASIEQLRQRFGEIGDQRLTVMAAITMVDREAETGRRLQQAEAEIASLEEARAAVVERETDMEARVAAAIEDVAARLEALAGRVSGAAANGRDEG